MSLPALYQRGLLTVLRAACLLACAGFVLLPVVTAADALSPDAPRRRVWLPFAQSVALPTSDNRYETVPILPPPTGLAAAQHGDLNLALRGYSSTSANLGFATYNGPTDSDAPQMPGIFADRRTPKFTGVHRVNDWNWSCAAHGCRGAPLSYPPVTLLSMGTKPGEPLSAPSRGAEIHPGGYKTLVLYADENRITLKYTRDDNVVSGYTVHLENLHIDPNLLALYRQSDASGRSALPALRDGQPLGSASDSPVLVAIRDCGSFLDPRSRKDWWQGR